MLERSSGGLATSHDVHDGALVRSLLIAALDDGDLGAGLDHLLGDGVVQRTLQVVRIVAVDASDTAGQVDLLVDLGVSCAGEDLNFRPILGNEAGSSARFGRYKNQLNVLLVEDGGADRRSQGLGGRGVARVLSQRLVRILVVEGALGLTNDVGDAGDVLNRAFAMRGDVVELYGIRAVEHGCSDVRSLNTAGLGNLRVLHGLAHLRRDDNGFGGKVGLLNHPLLGDEDLFGRNLHLKVGAEEHNAVGDLEDFLKVTKRLLVLDLCDDLDVLSLLLHEDVANGLDI